MGLIHEKKQGSKISCYCPFKRVKWSTRERNKRKMGVGSKDWRLAGEEKYIPTYINILRDLGSLGGKYPFP
jgi:hypothetical protein